MAPEQISVNPAAPPVGKASDIFALGALLYTMLTLAPPFSGKNNEEVLLKTLTEDPEKSSRTAPKGMRVSRELELICRKAMAKDPADRYQSVMELRMAVLAFQNRSFQSALSHRQRRHLISGVILILFIFITLAIAFRANCSVNKSFSITFWTNTTNFNSITICCFMNAQQQSIYIWII